MAKRQKLDDDTLRDLTQRWIDSAAAFVDQEIAESREKALRYYEGQNPDGMPLKEGRSKMVDPVVRDTIEWIMPSLMRIFAAGDKWISVEPHGPEDAQKARATEAWVNYVCQRMNPGYLLDYQWIRDALLEKVGWQKIYWDVTEQDEKATFAGVTTQELELIRAQPGVEIDEVEEMPGGDGMPLYTVSVEVEKREAVLRISTIPPEEILYTEDATLDRSSWWFLAHKSEKRLSELRAMGFDVADDINGPELESLDNDERNSDNAGIDLDDDDVAAVDPAARKVWLYECYLRHDKDGDGIAEWLQIMRVGDEILSVEEIDDVPLVCISPVLRSHRLTGYSIADLCLDMQDLSTAIQRNIYDHLYATVAPRSELDVTGLTEHTVGDYLDNRFGGFIRVRKLGTVNPLVSSPLPPYAFELLNHVQAKTEARTGVTRFNQGLSPDTLNKTATGTSLVMQAANARLELIARNLAETGFKDRVQQIIRLSAAHPEYLAQRTVQLSGVPLQLTADDLVSSYDLVINTGIGTGNREQQLQHIGALVQSYQMLAQAGAGPGSQNPLFSTLNMYNALAELLKLSGYRNTGDFLIDPQNPNAPRDPPAPPPPPSVEQVLAQAELQKAQINAGKVQAEAQIEQQRTALDAQKAQQEMQLEALRVQLEQQKVALAERELALKEYELRAKTNAELLAAQAGADEKSVGAVVDFEQSLWERNLKERELALKEREAMLRERESRLGEAKTRAELGEAFDLPELEAERRESRTLETVIEALGALSRQLTAPKRVVRDADGAVIGVETLATGTEG
jgi:hypothetical protein